MGIKHTLERCESRFLYLDVNSIFLIYPCSVILSFLTTGNKSIIMDRIFGIKLMENILFTLQKLYAGKLYSTMRTFVSIIS